MMAMTRLGTGSGPALEIVSFCLGSSFDERKNSGQLLRVLFPGGLAEQLTPHRYIRFIEHYRSSLGQRSKVEAVRSRFWQGVCPVSHKFAITGRLFIDRAADHIHDQILSRFRPA